MSLDKSQNDWGWIKAKDFMLFNPKESIKKGTVVKNVPMDKIEPKTKEIPSYELTEYKGGVKFRNGDILMARITPCLENGKISQVSILDYNEIGAGSTEFIVLREKEGISDKDFIYYLSNSEYFKEPAIKSMVGSSGRQRVQRDVVENLEIYVPPLETQKKIGKVLSFFDKKISLNKKINKNLLSIADAIYKKEFQNFDTYSEDELIASDFGLIPKNWHYKTLDEISDVGIGKTPPRKETWWFSEQEGVKWVSIKDLGNSGTYIFETSEYLTNEAIEKFNVKLIPINTVILSFKLTVGRIGITTEEMVTNEAIAHFKLSENSVITKEYLYLYLKNFNYEELGSTSSIAKAINSKIVKKIPILIPNNKINEFKDLFENLFNKIKSNQLEINKLTKLRDTLLPKLMSGEIDVSEVNCDLKIIIRKIYIKSSKLFLWRYLSENKNYIKNTKSNETLLKSRTIYKINKFLAKFNARYRYYRQ